jgi:putative peptidoglycan lipid II flippase
MGSGGTDAAGEGADRSVRRVSARAAGVVALAVMCSRVLGLVREQVFGHLFGTTWQMDAFKMAFRIPNLLRDLFAEGALSTAFVTTFSRTAEGEGLESAWGLANRVTTFAVVVLSGLTLLGIAFSDGLVSLVAEGFTGEKLALTVYLTRLMFPFILLVSVAAVVMGILNARSVFGVPAMASTFFNIVSIVGGLGIGWWMDPTFGTRSLTGFAVGTLLGGLAQWLVQVPSLRGVGYRFSWDFRWRDPAMRRFLSVLGPALVAASAVQVNVMVNAQFASYQGDGAVSWLDFAFRLMQLPLGLFGVAIGTVALPSVSRSAEAGDLVGVRGILAHGLRLAAVLTVPATVGLWFLAEPLVALLYQHGAFDAESTRRTADALQYYAVGLAAYSGIKVISPAFYALDRRMMPMVVAFGAIATNALLNWSFLRWTGLGHRGLALATGLVATLNFTVLYRMMRGLLGGMETRGLAVTVGKCVLSSVAMVVGLLVYAWVFGRRLGSGAEGVLVVRALVLIGAIGFGAAVFWATALMLRLREVTELSSGLMRRLRRGRSTGGA